LPQRRVNYYEKGTIGCQNVQNGSFGWGRKSCGTLVGHVRRRGGRNLTDGSVSEGVPLKRPPKRGLDPFWKRVPGTREGRLRSLRPGKSTDRGGEGNPVGPGKQKLRVEQGVLSN